MPTWQVTRKSSRGRGSESAMILTSEPDPSGICDCEPASRCLVDLGAEATTACFRASLRMVDSVFALAASLLFLAGKGSTIG
jgi:hypothetical protein